MTPEELDDIERRANVAGNIRPQRALALVAEVRRLRALTVDDPTSIYHEHEHLRAAMTELNRLRSNVIATQSASWSNAVYPMVAILDRAGFELIRDVTPEDMADHMLCYGGAGGSPDHLTPDARKGDLWRQRVAEAKERGTALQRLHAGGSNGTR